jgi:tetratricopeptide (TPR) repeat protein
MGRYLPALDSFRKAIALNPLNARNYNSAGYVHLTTGDYRESADYQRAALAICRNHSRQLTVNNDRKSKNFKKILTRNLRVLNELKEMAHIDKALAEYASATRHNPGKFVQTSLWTDSPEKSRLQDGKGKGCFPEKFEKIKKALESYLYCLEDAVKVAMCKTNSENKHVALNIVRKTAHSIVRICFYGKFFSREQNKEIIDIIVHQEKLVRIKLEKKTRIKG